jgi:hypothetical protein
MGGRRARVGHQRALQCELGFLVAPELEQPLPEHEPAVRRVLGPALQMRAELVHRLLALTGVMASLRERPREIPVVRKLGRRSLEARYRLFRRERRQP